jgi:hypothetical protein
MTTTNLNIGINHLSFSNQNSSATSTPVSSSKISNTSNLYLGPGSTSLPGITNLFYAPYHFVKSIKAILLAEQINDREAIVENRLRMTSNNLNFISSLGQTSWYILQGGIYFKILSETSQHSLAPLGAFISGIGFIICAIEGILETYGLVQTAQFYTHHYPSEIEAIKEIFNLTDPVQRQKKFTKFLEQFSSNTPLPTEVKNEIETFLRKKNYSNEEFSTLSTNLLDQIEKNIYLTKLQQLQRNYFQISSEEMTQIDVEIQKKFSNLSSTEQQQKKEIAIQAKLSKKKNDLARRVQPWLADEISQDASEIIQNLQSADAVKNKEAKEKAAEIFKNIKAQCQKKLLIHGVGLAAVLFTVAGLILSCAACPYLIPFFIIAIGGILAFARYYLYVGFIDSKGWEFKIENCIPDFIKSIFKKREERKVDSPTSLTLNFSLHPRHSYSQESHSPPKHNLDFTLKIPVGIRV